MNFLSGTGSIGGEGVALFLGGVFALIICAPLLVILKDRLTRDPKVPAWIIAIAGALYATVAYFAGTIAFGRGAELLHLTPSLLFVGGPPWAVTLAFMLGGVITYIGTRSSWHPAGSFALLSLTLALSGWIGFLLTERLAWAVAQHTLFQVAWVGFVLVQVAAATLLFLYATYTIDSLVRRHWKRAHTSVQHDPDIRPKVAIHVPSYNEEPSLVAKTLDSLLDQDYPKDRFLVILVDDTTDPEKLRGVKEVCSTRDVQFIHRQDRSGFKAGALNEALRQTPEDYEVIGVIDADFEVDPDFLKDNVGYFADPRISFVQTPQEVSNLDSTWVSRYAGIGQRFFYQTAMHTRNESEASMFCGSMGLLRRSALEGVGAWVDGHISEDADLSFRLKDAGHSSIYVGHKVYGRGLVPDAGESYRIQQARWANGGARLIRDYIGRILMGPMTFKQKTHHLTSSLFWFDGTLAVIFAFTTSVLALTFLAGGLTEPFHIPELAFIAILPLIIIADSVLRLAVVAKRRLQAASRDVFGLLMVWWSVKLVTATEAWSGLLGSSKPFNTTPKVSSQSLTRREAAIRALRAAPIESAIAAWSALLAIAVIARLAMVGGPLSEVVLFSAVAFVLSFYAVYFSSAWIAIYMGHTTRRQGPLPKAPRPLEGEPQIV
jgi:cellulose synthase/poly-beta-1,6-N-acetylglucosamine synthase-like glycosyltransferase